MEPIKVEDNDVKKAIQSGHPYIQVDARKYMLMEVQEVNAGYIVTDPEEEKLLLAALREPNPTLTDEEVKKCLG